MHKSTLRLFLVLEHIIDKVDPLTSHKLHHSYPSINASAHHEQCELLALHIKE
jgi:hypothetical protein